MENYEALQQYLKEDANIDEVKSIIEKDNEKLVSRDNLKKDYSELLKELPELQGSFDKYFQKGLDTWKANNLEKLVNERLNELNPPKTEAEKKLMELEQKFLNSEKEKLIEKQRNAIYKKAKDVKLPDEVILKAENFISESEEKNIELVTLLSEAYQLGAGKTKEEILKNNGVNIQQGNGNNTDYISREQYNTMSLEEKEKNHDKIMKSLKTWKN